MKLNIVFIFVACIAIIFCSCVKDRLYLTDSTVPDKPAVPVDSTIKLTINEFLASNSSVSVPGNTNFPDWIEIYNAEKLM